MIYTPGQRISVLLNVGDQLTVEPSGGTTRVYSKGSDGLPGTPAALTSSTTYGPNDTAQAYELAVDSGTMQYSTAKPSPLALAQLSAAALYQPLNSTLTCSGGTKIMAAAGVPTDGVTGAGTAEKGSLYLDITNGKAYVNGGTLGSPTWKIVTSAV